MQILKTLLLATTVISGVVIAQQPVAANEMHIRMTPDDHIILNPTNSRRGYYDFVVHNIGFVNLTGQSLVLEGLTIDVIQQDKIILSKAIGSERLLRDTNALRQPGLPIFAAFQLLQAGGVSEFLGDHGEAAVLSETMQMAHGNGMITSAHHFSIDAPADTLTVTARYLHQDGSPGTVSRDIVIGPHSSPISYRMPLQGAWLMRSLPAIESHHRLNAATEFAVDFFKSDADGRIVNGDRVLAANYPGYGQAVLAAADGVVVKVIHDAKQDRQAMQLKDGETRQDAMRRMQQLQMQAFQADARKAAGGNLVTIKHQQGEHVEYSSYGHLAAGSVKVKVGDQVRAGQPIAAVGDTGDSPVVHLHFQLNTGPDAFLTKSLPVSFADISFPIRPPEPGMMVNNDGQAQ